MSNFTTYLRGVEL